MDKKELFNKLRKIADGEKYFSFQNSYYRVNENKTINNCFEGMTWEYFFKIYDKLSKKEKDKVDAEINEKCKSDDEKINLFIKILIGVSKKNNFYNLLAEKITPYRINTLIKEYYYSTLNRICYDASLLGMFNSIKNNNKTNLVLFFKLNNPNIFNEILSETYANLKDTIISYLQENEIYDNFNSLIASNEYFKSFDDYYNFKIKHKDDITNFLIGPFSWHTSKDGFDFWKKKQEDFTKFIIKKLITPL